jgi:hypothetical protein
MRLIEADCRPIDLQCPCISKQIPKAERDLIALQLYIMCFVIEDSGYVFRTVGPLCVPK